MPFVHKSPTCARIFIFAFFVLFLGATFAASFGREASEGSFRQVRPDKANVVDFESRAAKFLRFEIFSSQNGTPAIDELQIFGSNAEDAPEDAPNLALADVKKVDASSCIPGYEIHQIANVVDGKFGNSASWVAEDAPTKDAPQWLQIEWNEPVEIARVVYSRDREGRFVDRVPLDVAILLSNDGQSWNCVAKIRGVTANVSAGGLSQAGSSWFIDVPQGAAIDLARKSNSKTNATLSNYDLALQNAFLGEENALLKIAGFADCEPWLLQRHYPEYVEPLHKPEIVASLPTFEQAPTDDNDEAFWKRASAGTVWAFAAGSFENGPVVAQTARAAIVGKSLYLRLSGNRFLSENRALVSSENLPTRGLILVRDGKIYWKQVDAFDGRESGAEFELQGRYDAATGELETSIPLEWTPEATTRGVYVGLAIGARWVPNGGRPVHFRPADFAASIQDVDDDAKFTVRAETTNANGTTLIVDSKEIKLTPGKPVDFEIQGKFGEVGPEVILDVNEQELGAAFRLVGFQYDPCYRPFCQLKDSFKRASGDSEVDLDARDFAKRVATPGVANPRYVDVDAEVKALNLPNEREDLTRYFDALEPQDEYQTRALALWKEYRALRKDAQGNERALFWKLRILKREFFLASDELEPVEHILANKRNPFWPSHNYSDLFDSQWAPDGAVVLIDIPRENGRLAPERATTREIVQAGDGVIRNPSASFDATKIYYALRANQNEYFRIHELDLSTGKTRRISADGPFHDFWPTELPDGALAFISTRCKKKFICWRPQAFVLHRMNKEGGDITPLSFANLSEFAPSVCDDGRLLWTRSEYVDKGADYGHTLWTIRSDGTAPELTFGNTINLPQGYANGRRVPDSDDVSCVLISHFGDLNGPIALLDQAKGPHDPSAIRSITPEVPWPGFWARSETFREPFPISRDVLLVAHAPFERFGLYLIDRFGDRELLTIDDAIDTICPQPFGPREVPPVVKSAIEPNLAQEKLGRFSVANVYRGLEGQVEPGKAKYLRVCQEMPTPLAQMPDGTYQADHEPFMEYYASPVDVLQGAFGWSSYVAKGVLGTVEIEEDGSVDFLAPAEKVLFFELLDENYNEIQRMRSVVQLRAGEQRSCVGCHESRLSTPEGGLTLASGGVSQRLVAPPWGAGPFWYEKTVQPILDAKCVECHTSETESTNQRQIDLTSALDANKIPASYRSLILSGDVHYFDYTWGAGKTTKAAPYSFGTFQSKLWNVLQDANHRGVKLESAEEQALKCWIDLNVPLWGDYQKRSERE